MKGKQHSRGFCAFMLQITRNVEWVTGWIKASAYSKHPTESKKIKLNIFSYAFIIILSGKSGNYQPAKRGFKYAKAERKLKSFIPSSFLIGFAV